MRSENEKEEDLFHGCQKRCFHDYQHPDGYHTINYTYKTTLIIKKREPVKS